MALAVRWRHETHLIDFFASRADLRRLYPPRSTNSLN